ncbi:DMT family transporter [Martelella lutilitoris]|uniref:DMT family transporter n=1 Tax=Martelella lutilitoris TaxID=2583532 RepID=A0A7T7HLS8_9HYPH|nr:DMT family transporter [Martelella lutilitoris]QQM31571.1 DMT family transporter [Martelella lutilitoris]
MAYKIPGSIFSGGPARGIALITASVFLLSLSDALVKLSGVRFALVQLIFLRSFFAALLLALGLKLFARGTRLVPQRLGWVTARSLCLVSMWFCYYASLPELPFSLAAACYYTAPLWMALLARFILKEPVGLVRWCAIVIALAGVVVSVNPAAGSASPFVLLPLLAAFFYALAAIITWSKCRDEAPFAMALNLNVALAASGAAGIAGLQLFPAGDGFVFAAWRPLDASDWAVIGLLAIFLVAITTGVAAAYRAAPAPVVGLFDNAYLVFAALWSVVIFADHPSALEIVGLVMIGVGAVMAARPPRSR